MFRFLILALPLVILALALFHFAGEALDLDQPVKLGAPFLLGRWVLEALGLTALYVLVYERGFGRWAAGLAACWTAWLFRGPVLALVVAGDVRFGASDWWRLLVAWLLLYTVCGLVMGAVARSLEREAERLEGRGESPEAATEASVSRPVTSSETAVGAGPDDERDDEDEEIRATPEEVR